MQFFWFSAKIFEVEPEVHMYRLSPTVNDFSDTLGKLFNLGKIMAKLCEQLLFILGITLTTWTREFRTLRKQISSRKRKVGGQNLNRTQIV